MAPPKYQSDWIRRNEALTLLKERADLDLGPAGRWLEQLKHDRPPVPEDKADPTQHLFRRISRPYRDHFRIGLYDFGDGLVGIGWEQIEISWAMLLARLPQRKPAKGKAGAKPKYDWSDAKEFAIKQRKERGPFTDFDDGWKGQADLERLVAEYMSRYDPAGEPSETQLKAYVGEWLREFEAGN